MMKLELPFTLFSNSLVIKKLSHLGHCKKLISPKTEKILGLYNLVPSPSAQTYFCPGQNQTCPRQNNSVLDKTQFLQDKNFVHGLKVIFAFLETLFKPWTKFLFWTKNHFVLTNLIKTYFFLGRQTGHWYLFKRLEFLSWILQLRKYNEPEQL